MGNPVYIYTQVYLKYLSFRKKLFFYLNFTFLLDMCNICMFVYLCDLRCICIAVRSVCRIILDLYKVGYLEK